MPVWARWYVTQTIWLLCKLGMGTYPRTILSTEAIPTRPQTQLLIKQTPQNINANPAKKPVQPLREQSCPGFSIVLFYIATLTTIFLIGAGPSTANPGR